MARKRRKAAETDLHPMFRRIGGRMGRIVHSFAHRDMTAKTQKRMSYIAWIFVIALFLLRNEYKTPLAPGVFDCLAGFLL
jgi:hypothetical protein